jgi:hypothetical protein
MSVRTGPKHGEIRQEIPQQLDWNHYGNGLDLLVTEWSRTPYTHS